MVEKLFIFEYRQLCFWEYFFSKYFLRVDTPSSTKIGGGVHLYCRHRRWGSNRDRNILVYLRSFLEKSTSLLYLHTYIACPCINQMLNRKSFCIICLVCLGTFFIYCYDCIYTFLYSTYFCYAYVDSSSVDGVDHPKKFIELV